MRRGYRYRPPTRRLLPDGKALTGRVVEIIQARRTDENFGAAFGVTGRTVRRLKDGGATLHQALAIAGAELDGGELQVCAYVLSMIGDTSHRSPVWGPDDIRAHS